MEIQQLSNWLKYRACTYTCVQWRNWNKNFEVSAHSDIFFLLSDAHKCKLVLSYLLAHQCKYFTEEGTADRNVIPLDEIKVD